MSTALLAERPRRNLPARLKPTPLSTKAANLLHSVVYDAEKVGESATPDNYVHLAASRMALIRYISRLEERLGIQQHQFYRFD